MSDGTLTEHGEVFETRIEFIAHFLKSRFRTLDLTRR